MKIGVSSYSFSRLVNSAAMSQLDVISKARDMGFDIIEFSTLSLPEGETPLTFAPKIREEAARVGIEVGKYTIGADFLRAASVEEEAERLKSEVDAAVLMGAPGMRHDATQGFPAGYMGARDFEAALPKLARGCKLVTQYAAEKGVRTMVENHGFFAQDSSRVEKLMNAVDDPNFGWLVDMGNFLCADEDPVKAVGVAARYAFHVHAKDFHVKSGMLPNPGEGFFQSRGGNYLRGAIIGQGEVPVLQCLRILKNAGYAGTISIEYEGIEDPLLGIRIGFENLKRFIDMI